MKITQDNDPINPRKVDKETSTMLCLPKEPIGAFYAVSIEDAKTAAAQGTYSSVFLDVTDLFNDKLYFIAQVATPDVFAPLWTARDIMNNSNVDEATAIKLIAYLADNADDTYDYIQDVLDSSEFKAWAM